MVLNDLMIRRWAAAGGVSPFDDSLVNPASLDLRIGDEIIDLSDDLQDVRKVSEINLFPGKSVLATTVEFVNLPANIAGAVYLKSS